MAPTSSSDFTNAARAARPAIGRSTTKYSPGPRATAHALRIAAPTLALLVAGCLQTHSPSAPKSASLDVHDIIQRCADEYADLNTFHARGTLRDCRTGEIHRIEWDYVRPDRLRLQIGAKLALVFGRDRWSYTPDQPGFHRHRQFTTTPLRTTADLLSGGVPLFLPAVFETGRRAFGDWGAAGSDRWVFRTVDWRGSAPCYVLDNPNPRGLPGGTRTLWIDQDNFLVRGWAVGAAPPHGPPAAVWDCTYTNVDINVPVRPDRFRLIEPRREPQLAKSDESQEP